MSHPPASYLSPDVLDGALQLARQLQQASRDVGILTTGARAGAGGGGRAGDAAQAMRRWVGPHRDTFAQLMENEMDSAQVTQARLEEEADAWARFWAEATNAREQRLYEESMADHRRAMNHYHTAYASYVDEIEADPAAAGYLWPPRRPAGPAPPVNVGVPTAAGGYQPTG